MGFNYYAGTAGGGGGGLLTASNGLTAVGSDVQLGGSLDNATLIDVGTHDLFIGPSDFSFGVDISGDSVSAIASSANGSTVLGVNDINFVLLSNLPTGQQQFANSSTGFSLLDAAFKIGMGYDGDYHVNGLATDGDRWIPDVGYVKTLLGSTDSGVINNGNSTADLFTYNNGPVNALYEIGGALEILTGVGSVVLNCDYTDWTGTAKTISFLSTETLMVEASIAIHVYVTVTGVATFNAAAYIKFLF